MSFEIVGMWPLITPYEQRTGCLIFKEAWKTLPDAVKAAINAQDFEATALGGHRAFTVAEAIVWNAMYGQTAAVLAAQAARPSNPSYAKTVIVRAVVQAKCAKLNGDYSCTEASVIAFLKHEVDVEVDVEYKDRLKMIFWGYFGRVTC